MQAQFFSARLTSVIDIEALATLPIKVLVKGADAKVTIGEGAELRVDNVIGIYATAASDASSQAKSQLISIGYSQAKASASVSSASTYGRPALWHSNHRTGMSALPAALNSGQ